VTRARNADPAPPFPPRDPGLFGPDSVTWRVHSDPSMLLAGLRAMLLQATHPLVMAGFAANSGFRDDPWGRLQRTGQWIATVTYASTEDAERAGRRLRRLHAGLGEGIEPETGRSYRVSDPDLLTWVHCTEVESFLSTYRRCGGPLASGEADRYVREMRRSGELVGLSPDSLPATEQDLRDYYRRVRPQLMVTAAARRTALWGFAPPMPGWVAWATPARPAWAALVSVAAGMLPRWARRLYGLPALPSTDLAASVSGRLLRSGLLRLPVSGPQEQARRRREGSRGAGVSSGRDGDCATSGTRSAAATAR
jgi:uncharacterized protein (DUF2236 family)